MAVQAVDEWVVVVVMRCTVVMVVPLRAVFMIRVRVYGFVVNQSCPAEGVYLTALCKTSRLVFLYALSSQGASLSIWPALCS